MKDLAQLLRCLQLFTHSSHNLIKGPSFFADHEFLGELYPTYESEYDSIIERLLGLNQLNADELKQIQSEASDLLESLPLSASPQEIFKTLIMGEQSIQSTCKKITGSIGTLNLIAQICDNSEQRVYKFQQRSL